MTDRRPELEPLLPREPRSYDPGPEVVDAMLAELMGMTLRREPTWRERLAERSTQQRGLIVGAGLAVVSAMWLGMMGWRGDLMGVDLARYVGLSLVLVASAGFAVEGALRAVGRRALTPGLVAVGLALPVLLAALPGAWPGMRPPEGIPFDAHLMCGAMGTMLGLAYCVPMLLVQRGRPDATRLALVGGAAGAAAFVVQNLVCGAGETTHLVFAHGFVGAAIAAALVLGERVSRRA